MAYLNTKIPNKYFIDARTAFQYGIMHYKNKNRLSQSILVPETICDVIIEPLLHLNFDVKYYKLNDDLTPDWKYLEKKINERTLGLMMVHFFGIPQHLDKFLKICKKYNIILIEDNAHGHGGFLEGKQLGTFGDIGFSSPRKNFLLLSGGCFYSNNNANVNIEISKPKISFILKRIIKRFLIKNNSINTNRKFVQKASFDFVSIDFFSFYVLKKIDIKKMSIQYEKIFLYWLDFAKKNGIFPIFNEIDKNLIPWAFPAYVGSKTERDEWIKWGKNKKLNIFSWPRLPRDVVKKNNSTMNRWERMICFPIEPWMSPKKLDKSIK